MKLFLNLFILHLTFSPLLSNAEDPEPFNIFPEVPEKGENINAFIPAGWNILDSSSGLLDNDEMPDVAVIIQLVDTSQLKKILTDDTLSEISRPRILFILNQTVDGTYVKSCQSNQAILGENEGGDAGDPFQNIEIKDRVLFFSFSGISDVQWNLAYSFRYNIDGFYLFEALAKGESTSESYNYEYNLKSGKLSIELLDKNLPEENLKYSKIKAAVGQPRLENFLPMSYVVDETEGIIF